MVHVSGGKHGNSKLHNRYSSGSFLCFAVWFLYKKAYQLQQVNHNEQTDQLVGRECVIYFKQSDSKYTVQTTRDGAMREVDVISESGKHIRLATEQ